MQPEGECATSLRESGTRICSSYSSAKRDRRKGDDLKLWLGNEKKSVLFCLVQPGVVSTCKVTERISFVNSFAAVFRKGV